MTRNVHTFVLCVAGLALGGCYDHRTVEESEISPIEGADAGVDEPGENGGQNEGGNEGNSGGENEGGGDPGDGPFGDLDCENPPDPITELLCGLQDGGGGMSTGGFPGMPGGSTGGRPGGTTGGRPGGTTGGRPGMSGGMNPTTGGFPGMPTGGTNAPTDPGEIIREIIENLDCDQKEPDFITQLLCSLTQGGGGFPGGGGGPGGGGPFGGNR